MQNFPNQGSNPCPLQWKLRVLTTGPPLLPFLIPLTSISYPAATWRLCHLTKTPVSNHFLFQTLLTPVRWSLHSLPYKTFALVTLSNCPAIPQHSGFPGGSAVKDPPAMQELQETWVQSLGQKDSLRRAGQPTLVFSPGESHGQRSLVGYCPWGHRVRNDWSNWACTHLRVLWTHPILSFADTIPSLWIPLLCPIYLTPIPSPGLMRISKISLTSSLSKVPSSQQCEDDWMHPGPHPCTWCHCIMHATVLSCHHRHWDPPPQEKTPWLPQCLTGPVPGSPSSMCLQKE